MMIAGCCQGADRSALFNVIPYCRAVPAYFYVGSPGSDTEFYGGIIFSPCTRHISIYLHFGIVILSVILSFCNSVPWGIIFISVLKLYSRWVNGPPLKTLAPWVSRHRSWKHSHRECPDVLGNSNIYIYMRNEHILTYSVFVVHLKFVTYGVFEVAVYLEFIIHVEP